MNKLAHTLEILFSILMYVIFISSSPIYATTKITTINNNAGNTTIDIYCSAKHPDEKGCVYVIPARAFDPMKIKPKSQGMWGAYSGAPKPKIYYCNPDENVVTANNDIRHSCFDK